MPQFIPIDFDPFTRDDEIEKLTFTNEPQREIWLSCVIGSDDANRSYNESVSLKITGSLDVEAFKQAIAGLVQRHEALRATVSPNGENLIIYKNVPNDLPLTDLTFLDETEREKAFYCFLKKEAETVLNIKEGPLFKTFLHRTGEQEYFFTLIIHHIIGDGWSTGIILEDLSKLYNSYVKGEDDDLSPASQISDYVEAQEHFRLTDEYKKTEGFWLNLYKGDVPFLDLPTDNPRHSPRSYKGNRIDQSLAKERVEQLKKLGAKAGCSLVTTLLAAFDIFLYQLTHQRDLVVGVPSSGQAASGLNDVVGHCVNLLPIRTHIRPSETFLDYLLRRKKEVLDAYDHQRITFGELIKKLYIPRDPSRVALVPVMFNVDMGMDNDVSFEGLQHELISNPRAYENFELYLNATGSKEGMMLEWSYNTDLFNEETITTFYKQYDAILNKINSNAEATIAQLIFEEGKSVSVSRGTNVDIPSEWTLNSLIAESVSKYPNKIAVVYNNTELTYRQLNEKTEQLSLYLVSKGITAGDIVAISLDRSVEMLICLLAVLRAGGVYLPLDPEYPQERIRFMLHDSGAKLLLTSERFRYSDTSQAEEIIIETIWHQLSTLPKKKVAPVNGHSLAYLLYTSGSTGTPKGVKITHRNLVNFLSSMKETPGINDTDKLLAVTSISFDIAGLELYLPLIAGARLVIAGTEAAKDGRLLLDLIAQKNISLMQATPSTWQMLLDSGWEKPSPVKILSGGEALPLDLANKLLPLCSELWNMYGPTETTIWSTVKQLFPNENQITIGKPIHNTQVYIMDEDGHPLTARQTGEIYIGGEGVAEGYYNREKLTAEKFVIDPYSKNRGAKLYRTGDLGKLLTNGEIQCVGRIDHQVKLRGHRIELEEIEANVLKLEGIKQCVVIAREDVPGDKRLIGYVTLKNENAAITALSIIRVLKSTLPAYMVPDDFVVMKNMPLTPNAKIDRKALPKPQTKKDTHKGNVHPMTRDEQLIARIWSEVLETEDLNATDDFFQLGGHSLLAVKVMVALEKRTGKRLTIATLFEHSTIEKLAKQLRTEYNAKEWDVLVPIKTSGEKIPLFFVHGADLNVLLFKPIAEYMAPDQPVYGLQALGINNETSIPATIEEMVKRYIGDMIKAYPEGPYAIAGYSMGGFIGFEIARQLKLMGKKVAFLGIIDTFAGNYFEGSITKRIKHEVNKFAFLLRSVIRNPKESLTYQMSVARQKWKERFHRDGYIPENMFTSYEAEIYKKYNDALDDYKLTEADIRLTLFAVEKKLYYVEDPLTMGWNRFARKGVITHSVPGDHTTVLYPPNNKALAIKIQDVLDRKLNKQN